MSGDQTVHATIASLLLEKLDLHIPGTDTDLLETGLLDSLGFVELTVQLEETFGITIPIERLHIDNFRSIEAIAAFVTSQQSLQQRAADSADVLSKDVSPESNATV